MAHSGPGNPTGIRQAGRALRHRDYRYLWFGQTGHAASLWMDQVARAVLVLSLTNSALVLSFVIATRLVPILLFGLIAGAVADRGDKKRLLMSTQLVSMSMHLVLGLLAITGFVELWHVFVTAFISGTGMAFNQPVRQSLIPALVPREDLVNAIALNQAALSFMRIGGASLAGLLLIPFDVGEVYLVNVGIYAFVIFTTVRLRIPARPPRFREGQSLFGDLAEGFTYIRSNQVLGLVTLLALILFILGFPYQQVFVPLLATRVLDLGDSGVGYLAGATGVGAFLGSMFVAWRSDVARPGIQMLVNMLVFGAALVLISLQQNLVITAALLALCGAMTVTFMAYTNTILLDSSTPDMHGRVMSLLSLDRGLIPVGAIVAGLTVSAFGVQPALFIQGAAVIAISALVLLLAGKKLATIRRGQYPDEALDPDPTSGAAAPAG
ncbi:MAG: MFS transporter [Dehalococcoidia bacterium]